VIDRAIKAFGRLDGIVINHGVLLPMQKIADANVKEWKQVFDANFFSALALVCVIGSYLTSPTSD
jgi:NAD(P)-dependent dehydrogenase (short-subunit alcohol dehydrogenase family)